MPTIQSLVKKLKKLEEKARILKLKIKQAERKKINSIKLEQQYDSVMFSIVRLENKIAKQSIQNTIKKFKLKAKTSDFI